MCIAIAIPFNHTVSKNSFYTSWRSNPDGFGMMYSTGSMIATYKELYSVKKAWNAYCKIAGKYNTVLHFRIGTSGNKNLFNCHPFEVNSNLWFCHNGILDITVPKGSLINDTQIFNRDILKKLDKDFYKNKYTMSVLGAMIEHSKFIFLDNEGLISIVNEHLGTWDKGIWYSNTTYKPYYMNPYESSTHGWKTYAEKSDKIKQNKTIEGVCEYCGKILCKDDYYNDYCMECFYEIEDKDMGDYYDDDVQEDVYALIKTR